MKNKHIKKLQKAYKKSFKSLYKELFNNTLGSGLLFFVEYIKYHRDTMLLQCEDRAALATLTTAVAEFEVFKTETDPEKKQFHWQNFCELLKQNMEDWLSQNDSI